MNGLLLFMIVFGGFCLLFGVGYPLIALLIYPIYRIRGGKQSLKEYMKDL